MKKSFLVILLSLFVASSIFALEVSKSELQSAGDSGTIEFINYTGPHKVINSIKEIRAIGERLGKVVAKDVTKSVTEGDQNKYYVIHAVDETTGKMDADILFLGPDSAVDHITNLRRIISGYLVTAYGYSEKDADTLAVFITVYNAVYRGKIDTFQAKYKDIVTTNLSSKYCGLDINYKEWAGKSQIVIPLYDVKNGGLSTVNTSVISDTKVVQSMKEDDDRNVESRKDMVDIKEREAEIASDKAKESQKDAVEQQKKLKEEEAKTKQAEEDLAAAEKNAAEKKAEAENNPEDEEARKAAEQAEKEAAEKEAALREQEAKESEQKQKAEDAKAEAKEQQEFADKKEAEAQSERKEIAKDQNEVQKKEAAQANMTPEYGIIITDEKEMLSRLVKFSKETGEIMKNSPVTVIRNRTIYKVADGYLAVAGESGSGNQAVKLVVLDLDNMEIIKESKYTIASDSVLVKDGSDYYCVVYNDSKYFVAKFDEALNANIVSPVEAMSCTPISIADSGIVITGADGKFKVLDKKTLSE